MKNFILKSYLLPLFLLFISCSSDNDIKEDVKKEYLITQIASIEHYITDFDGIDNIWDYEYDENDKLIRVSQYNPRNTYYKIENNLIYNLNGILEKIKVVQNTPQHQDEYLISHEDGKVTLYNMGADEYNYYYNSDRIITKKEDVFIGSNTNFLKYSHNAKNQLTKVEGGTDGIIDYTRLFLDFDNSVSFQFFNSVLHPTREFIIMYAFDLKFNGLGKPSIWDFGYYEYDLDSNGNVSELKIFSDVEDIREYVGGYRFKYKEK